MAALCFCPVGASGWRLRMFSPAYGVNEDAATGSAAGPLALHLARHGRAAFGDKIKDHAGRGDGPSVAHGCDRPHGAGRAAPRAGGYGYRIAVGSWLHLGSTHEQRPGRASRAGLALGLGGGNCWRPCWARAQRIWPDMIIRTIALTVGIGLLAACDTEKRRERQRHPERLDLGRDRHRRRRAVDRRDPEPTTTLRDR